MNLIEWLLYTLACKYAQAGEMSQCLLGLDKRTLTAAFKVKVKGHELRGWKYVPGILEPQLEYMGRADLKERA